jgi:hypothetical protein
VAATGGRAVQLTKTASNMPIKSPDGQHVYFGRFTEGKFRLWRMRPDGGGESMVDAMPALRSDGYETDHLGQLSNRVAAGGLGCCCTLWLHGSPS